MNLLKAMTPGEAAVWAAAYVHSFTRSECRPPSGLCVPGREESYTGRRPGLLARYRPSGANLNDQHATR